tara:strand:- start:232 stop:747 length:516 start_codon:yes stop_codon:yes gene_type:complete
MSSIDLKFLERSTPHTTEADPNPNVVSNDQYIYKDIKLDLEIGTVVGNLPANKPLDNTDFDDLRDIADIKQSLTNILNTQPGQKLLNPYLGLNLSRFCFEPINSITGDALARAIIGGLPAQEPRITISNLNVVGDPMTGVYTCEFTLSMTNKIMRAFYLKGTLDTTGFKFE